MSLFSLSLLSPLLSLSSPYIFVGLLPHNFSFCFSFSIPPLLALSFCFYWHASRWDNTLMALLTGKTPTADFHLGKLRTKTIPYCQVEFHTLSQARALCLRVLLKSTETPDTSAIRKTLRRISVLSRLHCSLCVKFIISPFFIFLIVWSMDYLTLLKQNNVCIFLPLLLACKVDKHYIL